MTRRLHVVRWAELRLGIGSMAADNDLDSSRGATYEQLFA